MYIHRYRYICSTSFKCKIHSIFYSMICFVSLVGRTETEKMDKRLQHVGANGLLYVYCYSDTACGIRFFVFFNITVLE